MKVSVVVCTYSMSRFSDLSEAVQSLVEQTYKKIEIIIVVDHNKLLYEKLKSVYKNEPFLLIHNQDTKGLSGSKNCGIVAATGEIIAFLDDDAVASREWIKQMIKSYNDTDTVAVGGLTIPKWVYRKPFWFPEEFFWVLGCTYKGHTEKRAVVRNVFGGNSCFRKSCINATGKFSPYIGLCGKKMLTGEETEYCMRIRKIMPSSKIIFDPTAIILHKIPKTKTRLKYFIKRTYAFGYSSAIIYKMLPKSNLKTESTFLRHILLNFVPRTLIEFPRHPFTAIGQFSAVFIGVLSTGLGYIIGNIINVQRI